MSGILIGFGSIRWNRVKKLRGLRVASVILFSRFIGLPLGCQGALETRREVVVVERNDSFPAQLDQSFVARFSVLCDFAERRSRSAALLADRGM